MILFGSRFSQKLLIMIGAFITLFAEIALFIIAETWTSSASYWISCLLVAVLGASTSIYQSVVFGIGCTLGLKYMNGVMFGNGVSGLTCCFIRIFCMLCFATDNEGISNIYIYIYIGRKMGTWIFAGITVVILIVATLAIIPLFNNEFTRYYLQKSGGKDVVTEVDPEHETLMDSSVNIGFYTMCIYRAKHRQWTSQLRGCCKRS